MTDAPTGIDGSGTARAQCVLAPNPSPMTLDGTNTWVIAEPGSTAVLVVDPGPADEGHLRRVLSVASAGDRRVAQIVLTHGHPDHAAGAARFAELSGAPVGALDPALRLGSGLDSRATAVLSEHLFAVLREALSNAARHSGATRVDVTVDTNSDGMLTVLVRDNGSGIPEGGRRSGLANMADRADKLGGELRLSPAEGGGTELEWKVPVPPEPERPAGEDPLPSPPGRYPLR